MRPRRTRAAPARSWRGRALARGPASLASSRRRPSSSRRLAVGSTTPRMRRPRRPQCRARRRSHAGREGYPAPGPTSLPGTFGTRQRHGHAPAEAEASRVRRKCKKIRGPPLRREPGSVGATRQHLLGRAARLGRGLHGNHGRADGYSRPAAKPVPQCQPWFPEDPYYVLIDRDCDRLCRRLGLMGTTRRNASRYGVRATPPNGRHSLNAKSSSPTSGRGNTRNVSAGPRTANGPSRATLAASGSGVRLMCRRCNATAWTSRPRNRASPIK